MYYGFKHTKAVTYDECMGRVFGRIWGLVANIVIFIHVFGAVVSTWIFSYFFLDNFVQTVFGSSTKTYFFWIYFGVTLIIIYIVATFADVEKLKFIAIVGFMIIVYLLILFFAEIPEYFEYFNKKGWFKFEGAIASTFIFKTYGLTQYIFLNQYSIIPLCQNMKEFSFRRMKKVIFRTTCLIFVIYLCVLLSGYMSQPSLALLPDDYEISELFIMREPLPGKKDTALFVGKALFGVTLFIATLVKCQFFILYFYQILKNINNLRRGGTKAEILRKKYMKLQGEDKDKKEKLNENLLVENTIKLKPEERRKVMKRSNSAGRCIKFNVKREKLPELKEQSESKEVSDSENLMTADNYGRNDPKKQEFTISVNEIEDDKEGDLIEIPEGNEYEDENDQTENFQNNQIKVEMEEPVGRKRELSFGNEKELEMQKEKRLSQSLGKNEFESKHLGDNLNLEVKMPSLSPGNLLNTSQKNVFKTDQNSNDIEEETVDKENGEIRVNSFNPENKDLEKNKNNMTADKKKKQLKLGTKVTVKKMIINAVLLIVTTSLTLGLMNSLSTFLSAIGNFVGVFEIFVFPMLSVILINRKKKIVSDWHLVNFNFFVLSYKRKKKKLKN